MKDFSFPNILVKSITTINGTKIPPTPWTIDIHAVAVNLNASEPYPAFTAFSFTVVIKVIAGKPTPPKQTGVELQTRDTIAAANGGKPSPTNRGPANAAGVPKPAVLSIKAPNNQGIITTCKRLSFVILLNPLLITSIAPENFIVFRSRIAPKIVITISKPLKAPMMLHAPKSKRGIFHAAAAVITAITHPMGITFLEGILKTDKRTKMTAMGKRARKNIVNLLSKNNSLVYNRI